MIRVVALLAALILAAPDARAALTPDEMLDDPVLEQRARDMSRELRCLVCQNQAIDDSDAELARDLRRLVRERIEAGDSDDDVRAFLVARYGDFVLFRPPLRPETWLLWFGPGLVLVLGAGLALVYARGRRADGGDAPALTPEETAEIERLLARDERSRSG